VSALTILGKLFCREFEIKNFAEEFLRLLISEEQVRAFDD